MGGQGLFSASCEMPRDAIGKLTEVLCFFYLTMAKCTGSAKPMARIHQPSSGTSGPSSGMPVHLLVRPVAQNRPF